MTRRVNTRFLAILTTIILGGGLAAFVVQKLVIRERPQRFVDAGKIYLQEGRFQEAAENFRQAVALDSSDPELRVLYGDVLHALSRDDIQLLGKARAAWSNALEIQPDYLPALQRLLDSYWQESQLSPRVEAFDRVRETAARIIAAEPDNIRAQSLMHMAVLQAWFHNVLNDPDRVRESIGALTALMEKDPGNADLPLYIAQARIFQGQQYQRENNQPQASEEFAQAAAIFDKALAAKPDDSMLQYRAAQIFGGLSVMEQQKEIAGTYAARAGELIQTAQAGVKPQDAGYLDIQTHAANLAIRQGKLDRAEEIYRDVYAKRPADPLARLALAKFLAMHPKSRDEAIRLLSMRISPGDAMAGPSAGLLLRDAETQTLVLLAKLHLDAFETSKDETERQELMRLAEEKIAQILQKSGEGVEFLKLQGRVHLLRNQAVDAVQMLNRARVLQQSKPDDETNFLLARAYAVGQQTGQAKSLLMEIVQRHETYLPARLLLARLLAEDNSTLEQARHQIDYLEAMLPDHPDVIKLRIKTADPGQPETIKRYYAKLPEGNRAEMLDKAEAAAHQNDLDDAVRLLSSIRSADPGDPEATRILAQIYVSTDRKDQARRIVEEAIKANPEHKGLRYVQEQLADASAEKLIEMQKQFAQQIADPMTRELKLFELAKNQGKSDEALLHLQAAEKIKPQDPQIMDLLFQVYLSRKEWGSAEKYLEPLAKSGRDDAGGLLYRVRFNLAKGDFGNAIVLARELTQKLPEFARSWLSLGQALQAAGQFEEAVTNYEMALQKQSENIDALKGIIGSYYALNDSANAGRYIDRARQIFPNDAAFGEMRISHELKFGQPENAIPARQQAVQANPDLAANWVALGNAYLRAAQVKAKDNNAQVTRDYLDQAKQTFSQARMKWPDERLFYAYLADVALMNQDAAGGEKILKQLADREAWKDKPEPALMLADFYGRVGKLDEAEALLRDALAKSGGAVAVQQTLARLLAQRGKHDDALKVLETNGDNAEIQRQRVDLLVQSGKLDQAEQAALAALQNNPADASPFHNMLALIYLNQGKHEQALGHVNGVLDGNPDDLIGLYYRGLIRLRQAKPRLDEAMRDLSLVRDRNPSFIEPRIQLAEAYRRTNNPEGEIQELQAVLAMMPQNKIVRLRLLELYSATQPPRWNEAERLLGEAQSVAGQQPDPDWLYAESLMWLARRDFNKAMQKNEEARKLAPDNQLFTRSYLDILLQSKDYAALLAATDKIAVDNNAPWWVHHMRARAKRAQNDLAGALRDFQGALSAAAGEQNEQVGLSILQSVVNEIGVDQALGLISGDGGIDARWRVPAIYLYHAKRDYPAAIKIVEQLLADYDQLTPADQETALRAAGMVYLTAVPAHPEKAYQAYLRLLEKMPDDLMALNNIACLLAETINPPRPQEGLIYSKRAYELMQRRGTIEPQILDTHGWVLVLCGRVDDGIDLLRKVVEQNPFPAARYHLAEGYLKKSFPLEAKEQLVMAQEMMAAAEQKNQPVDLELKAKLQNAQERAQEMIVSKSEAHLQ